MACQRQDNECTSAVELIAERGLDGLGDAVSMLINEAMRMERERHLGVAASYDVYDQSVKLFVGHRGGRAGLEAALADFVRRLAPRLITDSEEYPEAHV